jgi:hypothetical protein
MLLGLPAIIGAAPLLPALGTESQVTVSGVSSGGYMAAQFAVAFSKDVKGLGVIAGGPYDCSQGNIAVATTRCSCQTPGFCSPPTPTVLAFQSWNEAEGKASINLIDSLNGLKTQRVWLFSGGKDTTVPFADVKALQRFYIDPDKGNVANGQVRFQRLAVAGHGMPVLDAPDGVACSRTAYPFLNNCAVDAAGDLLAWLYQGSRMATAPPEPGELLEFDQTAYTQGLEYTGLGDTGYVFVPNACTTAGAACRLHVVFHGCQQSRDSEAPSGARTGRLFVEQAGYNRWAAGSKIVVLYPQVEPHNTGIGYQYNPLGCWDFWGYTRLFPSTGIYATNAAPQMLAVMKMIGALQMAQ